MSNVQNLLGGVYWTVRVCASSSQTEGRRTFLRMVSGFTARASAGTPLDTRREYSGFPDVRDTKNRQKARNGRQAGLVPRSYSVEFIEQHNR